MSQIHGLLGDGRPVRLLGRAGRWTKLGAIRFFLEMGAGDKLTRQILGILHDGRDDQVGDAVGFVGPVVIFGACRYFGAIVDLQNGDGASAKRLVGGLDFASAKVATRKFAVTLSFGRNDLS